MAQDYSLLRGGVIQESGSGESQEMLVQALLKAEPNALEQESLQITQETNIVILLHQT